MARDYKDRGERRSKKRASTLTQAKPGRWLLIGGLIFGFIAFLVYLKSTAPVAKQGAASVQQDVADTQTVPSKVKATSAKQAKTAEKPRDDAAPADPEFMFYGILPAGEVMIPEHELKARVREELVGKGHSTKYTLQAGAFRDLKDADQLKAELALLGIVSKIETAVINGKPTWHRVRLGPYTQLDEVEKIKAQLKKNGNDVLVTEVSK